MSSNNANSCILCNSKASCFYSLNQEELGAAEMNRVEILYRKGEILAKQGNFYTHIIYLQEGMVKVYKELSDGSSLILNIFKKGSLIGLPFLFNNQQVLDYSVSAIMDSVVCAIDRKTVEKLISENSQFASKVVGILNQCTLYNYDRIVSLTHKQLNGRFADTLLFLSKNIYESDDFKLTLSRKDLAEYTGVSVMSIIRAIKDFKTDGIINVNGNHIEILKPEMLETISRTG